MSVSPTCPCCGARSRSLDEAARHRARHDAVPTAALVIQAVAERRREREARRLAWERAAEGDA